MLVGFQQLQQRIIAIPTTTTTCHTTCTQLPSVRSTSDLVGCDITIDDIQQAKQTMLSMNIDLKDDVNKWQNRYGTTPLIHFCSTRDLLIVK